MEAELREALQDIRDDVKKLLPVVQMVDRHELLLYGNGHDGILTAVEKIKARHKVYDRALTALSALFTAVGGDTILRHLKW